MNRGARLNLLAGCVAAACLAAACANSAPQTVLSGEVWHASAINGAPVQGPAPFIEFSADRVSGSSGCNHFFGDYAAQDGQVLISRLGATERACATSLMRQEQAFLAAIAAARRYASTPDDLTLYGPGGEIVVLRRGRGAP